MHRFRLYFSVLLLWILCVSASLCPAGGVAAKADPADYQHYRDLLYTLYDLEDPAFSDWSVGKTREMFGVLQELQAMKAKGFVLDKADALLKIQNRLVENMHAHCLVLAVADNPGTVLLRVGKTPNNPEFGGLLSAKVSDFDMTMAGKSASRARDTHLNLLKEFYGDDFAKMTMTDISTADATIAAWKLDDVRKAYATAALNPEMHRTYSGLSFVEDYIVQVGEISYMDKETGKLVTRKLADPEFNGDVTKFRNWANGVFEQAGEEMRFGMRKGGFCLGLTTDISNQLWMNLEKEENQAAPQNVIKKYVERYAKEVQARTQIDLRTGATGDSYNKIQELIAACDAKEPGALDRLKKQTLQFEEQLRETVYQKQSSLYEQMIAAGNHDVADAILLDTEGAYQNLESANRKLPTATAASLTEEVAKDIAREPVFVEPGVWRGWMNKVVCDDATLAKYLGGSTKVAIRIGPAIYAIYDAKQREEAGEYHELRYIVTRETMGLTFDGIPAALKWLGCKAEVSGFGVLGTCWGMMDTAAAGYDMWVDHLAQTMFVDPTVLPRLAGVTEEGKQINDTDIITALGEPITLDDLGAPARYPTGVYEMGEVVVEHDTNGDILRKHLSPSYKITDDYQRIADYNRNRLIWETEAQRRDDPPLQFPDHAWNTTRLTRGEMIAQNRLSRVYETLRRKFVKTYPGAGEKIAQLDARQLREPFHLAEPLEFDSPVGRDEIMFYWSQYNQAAIKCAAALQRETSVWRSVGFDAEKKLSDLSARKFLEAMARCAARNERAKEFYLNADALTLEAQLKLRIKAHFDGRDITPEEIQKRIDSLRAAEVASASGKTDVWKQWVKDHWDISMPADGDGPEPDFRIVSTMAVPAGTDAYRVVCRYRLKNQMSFDFHLVDKGSNTNFTSEEDDNDPECDKDLYAPGLRTLVFHVARAESDADATFLIRFTQPNSDQVIAASSDVVVPGMHRRYVFQGLSQIVGKPKYQTKSGYSDTVWTLVSGIDGRGVHLVAHRQSDGDHTWTHSEIWIGPMPAELKNRADFGAWMEALRTQHSLEEVVDGQKQQTTNLDGNLFSAAVSESDDNGKFDDQLHLTDLGGEASPKELDEAARLGLPPLHPAQGEGAEHAANLFSSKIDFVFTPPAEKRFRATVQVNGGPQLQFEWVYRLDSVQDPTPPSNTPTAQISQ